MRIVLSALLFLIALAPLTSMACEGFEQDMRALEQIVHAPPPPAPVQDTAAPAR